MIRKVCILPFICEILYMQKFPPLKNIFFFAICKEFVLEIIASIKTILNLCQSDVFSVKKYKTVFFHDLMNCIYFKMFIFTYFLPKNGLI